MLRARLVMFQRTAFERVGNRSAGDKEGEAAQNAVEEDDEDFDPKGGNKADEAEQVCISVCDHLLSSHAGYGYDCASIAPLPSQRSIAAS